jgi:hypothetical protein
MRSLPFDLFGFDRRCEHRKAWRCDMGDEQNGRMQGDRGDANAQPSAPKGDHPGTAGTGETKVTSKVPEKAEGQINPSSPGNTGTTPGTNAKFG